ncbi:MAG: arginyltransferase [Pseudomonadota bacterium]
MRKEDINQRFGLDAGNDFYITAPAPCPYLAGRYERKVFSFLGGDKASIANSTLTRRGFRRSQNIIYIPACERCTACTAVRILADDFEPSKSRRRILRRNGDLVRRLRPAKATSDQFSVLRTYLDHRHADGGMAEMTVLDYAAMVEETAVDTMIVEYWLERDGREQLLAAALTDRLEDGLSMVYSFFDPDHARRSLGQFMIMDHVTLARDLNLPHIYLGYWVKGSTKMDYKADFEPLEHLTKDGWKRSSV